MRSANAASVLALFSVIVLTLPNHEPIWIETQHIQTIRSAHKTCHPHAESAIRLEGGTILCVLERPQDIKDIANQK